MKWLAVGCVVIVVLLCLQTYRIARIQMGARPSVRDPTNAKLKQQNKNLNDHLIFHHARAKKACFDAQTTL